MRKIFPKQNKNRKGKKIIEPTQKALHLNNRIFTGGKKGREKGQGKVVKQNSKEFLKIDEHDFLDSKD